MVTIERECNGQCPKCMSEDIQYGVAYPMEQSYIYPCHCNACGIDFKEEYNLTYLVSSYKKEVEK